MRSKFSTIAMRGSRTIVLFIALILMVFVTGTSLIYYTKVSASDFVFTDSMERDQPFLVLLETILFVVIAFAFSKWLKRFGTIGEHVLFGVVWLIVMGFCVWWTANSQSVPGSDSKSVYDIAVRAMNHDLLPIAPTGSYMSLWPFQSGLLFYFEVIVRLGGDYSTIQYINCAWIGISLISGYFLVRRWFRETVTFWSIMMLFCMPYYLLVNYVYGDIPGLGLVFFSAWMLTEYVWQRKIRFLLSGAVALGGAIALRKNYLIYAIAVLLVMAVRLVVTEQKRFMAVGMATVFLVIAAANVLPIRFYELRAHNTMGEGVPAVSYIAMGLQGTGGWSGYHSGLYMECNYDAQLAKEISIQSIRESVSQMLQDPAYGVNFFYQKQIGQWCNETYGFIYETVYSFDNRTDAAWKIYSGEWTEPLCRIMNSYQSIVYMGALLFVAGSIWRKSNRQSVKIQTELLWKEIWLVTFIGGFFFTMIWEAASRYTLPYLVMLTPYASQGLQRACETGSNWIYKGICGWKQQRS